jgi:hypothetical protein
LTQGELGERVSLSQATVSLIERGHGGGLTLDAWQRIGVALDRPVIVALARDAHEEPADAGHLRMQELVLRLGRAWGAVRTFEPPTRPSDPARSTDVGLRDDPRRRLLLVECWNTIGDVGAAVRSTNRKLVEAEALAVAIAGDAAPYGVSGCWIVRATSRNRALVARYPEIFASRFPGSSRSWVATLNRGTTPPREAALVWCDAACRRLFEWRPGGGGGKR